MDATNLELQLSSPSETSLLEGASAQLLELIRKYAMGDLRTICEAHFANAGKGLRPKLIFRLSEALGVSQSRMQLARNWAVAIEILHNATLIHDDLQDGDRVRRNQPTVWARFGANAAINAGDFLLTIGPMMIDHQVEDEFRHRLKLHQLYSETAANLVNGQTLEFEMHATLEDLNRLETSYWECIELKTSALFSGAARGVAALADLDAGIAVHFENVFKHLGALFQLQDDLVDAFGNKQRDQVACDLREGKVSCLVLNHFKLHPNERSELIGHLSSDRESISDEMVHFWVNRFRQGGALAMAVEQVRERQKLIALGAGEMARPAVELLILKMQAELLRPIGNLLRESGDHG